MTDHFGDYLRTNLPVNLLEPAGFESFTTDCISGLRDKINYLFVDLLVKAFAVKSIVVKFVVYLFGVATVPEYPEAKLLSQLVMTVGQAD